MPAMINNQARDKYHSSVFFYSLHFHGKFSIENTVHTIFRRSCETKEKNEMQPQGQVQSKKVCLNIFIRVDVTQK